jgi:hypothetical protein
MVAKMTAQPTTKKAKRGCAQSHMISRLATRYRQPISCLNPAPLDRAARRLAERYHANSALARVAVALVETSIKDKEAQVALLADVGS